MTYPKSTSSETAGPIGKPGQSIRGGYLIARRHKESGILIRIASRPFEHGSLAEAEAEARRLAERDNDEFAVFAEVASAKPSLKEAVASLPAKPLPAVPEQLPRPAVIVERRAPRRRKTGGAA